MKTGDQIFTDISRAAGWIVAMIAILQEHGVTVPPAVASLMNDPKFVGLAVSGIFMVVVKVRQSKVAALVEQKIERL
jgi:hypothetical protein